MNEISKNLIKLIFYPCHHKISITKNLYLCHPNPYSKNSQSTSRDPRFLLPSQEFSLRDRPVLRQHGADRPRFCIGQNRRKLKMRLPLAHFSWFLVGSSVRCFSPKTISSRNACLCRRYRCSLGRNGVRISGSAQFDHKASNGQQRDDHKVGFRICNKD